VSRSREQVNTTNSLVIPSSLRFLSHPISYHRIVLPRVYAPLFNLYVGFVRSFFCFAVPHNTVLNRTASSPLNHRIPLERTCSDNSCAYFGG
jgi:hypothetical protein